MSESSVWEPDFTELAASTAWTRTEWRRCWDHLAENFRDEYHWPAVVGMAASFGFSPATAAKVINGYDAALTAAERGPARVADESEGT